MFGGSTMKLYKIIVAVTFVTTTILAKAVTTHQLKEAYVNRVRTLRNLLLSVDGNRELAQNIVNLQKKIKGIEDSNGITELGQDIAKLRVEACLIQNQNPQAKKILNRIKKLAKHVNQITESEQKEINRLTKIKENGKSSDESKEKLETQIHLLDKKIRQNPSHSAIKSMISI